MKKRLSASIVIVTVNRADSLDRTLQSLRQLRYDNFEAIVVDGPSVDRTQEVIRKHADFIRPFVNTVRNISAARNTGIAHAKGDIVVFIDDDAIPEPDWLDLIMAPYADPDVVSVGGFIRDPTGYGFQCKYTLVDRYGDARVYENASDFTLSDECLFSLTGTNFSTRRQHLLSIGGFDEEYVAFLDETDVNIRMVDRGWTAVVVPQAEIHHKFEPGYTRQKSPTPRTMYPQLRSKAYFCVVHNRGRKPLGDILGYLAGYVEREREWKRDLHRNGWADMATVERSGKSNGAWRTASTMRCGLPRLSGSRPLIWRWRRRARSSRSRSSCRRRSGCGSACSRGSIRRRATAVSGNGPRSWPPAWRRADTR
jgi:glycosyltransferase involved in cell wall biosynthesis